jgi:hypothetical protein
MSAIPGKEGEAIACFSGRPQIFAYSAEIQTWAMPPAAVQPTAR